MTPFVEFVKKHFEEKELVGIEIGVRRGINTVWLLEGLKIKKLYLVDPFLPYFDMHRFYGKEEQDGELFTLFNNIKNREENIFLLKETSIMARNFFQPQQFDFVYIDANHKYECVKDDLNWFDYVSSGGIIGGHDYQAGTYGVKRAVDECAENNKLVVYNLGPREDGGVEWAIIKP